MNKPKTDATPQKAGCSSANCSALADLLANLDEWAEHFRQERHGAVLTILRAKKTISDQASRIGELLGAIEQLSSAWGRADNTKSDTGHETTRTVALVPVDDSGLDAFISAVVPGGDVCDPQSVADAIRHYF